MVPSNEGPLLPKFYAGRSVFITGATGFLGKVLVERLLATCPEVSHIHLLMRDKRGVAPHKRLTQLKQSQVFDKIREQCPQQLEKLTVVSGDVTQPLLGLSAEDISNMREISLVFHSAANIKFMEPLSDAVQQNVRSVLALLDLCNHLPNLQAVLYVSTAYSNAERHVIEERVYPPPVDPNRLLHAVESLPSDLLADITPRYISPKPNTYVFTKSMAEAVLQQRWTRQYALAILRPAIVVSSYRYPFPGWVEGLMGTQGVNVGMGQGVLHTICASGCSRADLVPVDIVVDSLLAASWETVTDNPPEVRVYNCSSQENPTRWCDLRDGIIRSLKDHPFDGAFWYPFLFLIENRFWHGMVEFVVQTVPMYFAEYLSRIFRFKSQVNLITMSERLSAMNAALSFFVQNEWFFEVDNLRTLRERLTPQDRAIYNLDINGVNWDEQFLNMVKGIRKYLLLQSEESLETAKRHMNRLRLLHNFAIFVILYICYKLFMFLISIIL